MKQYRDISLEISTEPHCRVRTVAQFADNVIARLDRTTQMYGIEVFGIVVWEAFLLEGASRHRL